MNKPLQETKKSQLPFLKWAGGKRWLAHRIESLLPEKYNKYIEPFLGGGALFFYLKPYPALLADINPELINTYQQIRDNVEEVISELSQLRISKDVYNRFRTMKPRTPLSRAVRFLYLNRTSFNGIYRVNQEGKFNVPYGCKPGTILCDEELLRHASKALQGRKIVAQNFEGVIDQARFGDLIYADPPYTTKHNNNGFRRYNEIIFSWEDQERLAKSLERALDRGVHVIMSNANHAPLIELYDKRFTVQSVVRKSLIGASIASRGSISECLIHQIHKL